MDWLFIPGKLYRLRNIVQCKEKFFGLKKKIKKYIDVVCYIEIISLAVMSFCHNYVLINIDHEYLSSVSMS